MKSPDTIYPCFQKNKLLRVQTPGKKSMCFKGVLFCCCNHPYKILWQHQICLQLQLILKSFRALGIKLHVSSRFLLQKQIRFCNNK